MTTTRRIAQEELQATFERFTREHLANRDATITIEVISEYDGDQETEHDARLLGVRWRPQQELLDVAVEGVDHLAFSPTAVYVVEEEDGFISAIEVLQEDGAKQILAIRRPAPLARPAAPGP